MLFALFASYVAIVAETSIAPLLGWGALTPRPVLAALVCIVWRANGRAGLLLAAVWGLIADGLSTGPLGVDVILFVVAAAVVQTLRVRLPSRSLVIGFFAGVMAFLVPIAGTSVRLAVENQTIDWERMCIAAAGTACSTGLLATTLVFAWHVLFGRDANVDHESIAHVSNRWKMLTE